MMTETSERPGAGATAALATLLAVGVAISAWLVRIKLHLEFDPGYQSSCNFGDKLNCDLVQTSDWSTVFGHPLAVWGATTYLVLLVLVVLARRGGAIGRDRLAAVVVIGAVACLHSAWLASISAFVIGAWCIFCMILYGVNLGVTVTAALAFRKLAPLGDTLALVTRRSVLGAGALAVAGSMALTLPAYHLIRRDMAATRIELAKAQMATVRVAEPAAKAPKAGSTAPPSEKQAAAPVAAAPAGVITHPQGFRYSQVILRKGRSFFEVPISKHDFVLGPANAPVTVVEFADFECGYCRALSRNIKPLREKYKKDVRWVFKHFPLDNACNKVMKGTQHPNACVAAKAANCAGLQGRFWPMHDKLYSVSLRLNRVNLRRWAEEAKVADLAQWDRCMDSDQGHIKTTEDSRAGRFARIAGTPRTYINGHLVPGVVATEVFDYYLGAALAQAHAAAAAPVPAPTGQGDVKHGMVRATSASGTFWIDAFEGSLDAKGRALSVSGAMPAEVSWYEARDACKKVGKRLCTANEWVSACTGAPAVDNDEDGDLTDDVVEGTMFPYGAFHEGGRCNDDAGSSGRAKATGSMARCRSSAGIFDQSGNLAEWAGESEKEGWLLGTDFRWGAKATCMLRTRRFGLGYRNTTTGFRCCADEPVAAKGGDAVRHDGHGQPGGALPAFSIDDGKGGKVTSASLKGKVTIVSFFASWCGACRRELPDLQKFWTEHKAKGVELLAVGVDTDAADSKRFVEELKVGFRVGYDAKAVAMGAFGVRGMPTSFVVDRNGRVIRRLVGINAEKMAAFKRAALLSVESKP